MQFNEIEANSVSTDNLFSGSSSNSEHSQAALRHLKKHHVHTREARAVPERQEGEIRM
jgi:hypothetical protein